MAPDTSKIQSLTADYQSETGQKQFKHDIGTVSEDMPMDERVAYLGKLRASVVTLQDEVNAFLTKKMEEDKASAGQAHALDDKNEEDNYGEEVVDDPNQ